MWLGKIQTTCCNILPPCQNSPAPAVIWSIYLNTTDRTQCSDLTPSWNQLHWNILTPASSYDVTQQHCSSTWPHPILGLVSSAASTQKASRIQLYELFINYNYDIVFLTWVDCTCCSHLLLPVKTTLRGWQGPLFMCTDHTTGTHWSPRRWIYLSSWCPSADLQSTFCASDHKSFARDTWWRLLSPYPNSNSIDKSDFRQWEIQNYYLLININVTRKGTSLTLVTGSRPNEELTTTTTAPWHSRTLSSCTLYGELSIACAPEEFASIRTRLQQEWSVAGGFISRLTIALLDSQLIYHSTYSSWVLLCKFYSPYIGDSVC